MTYYEIRLLDLWSLRTCATQPAMQDGRIVSANGQGPRVRGIKTVLPELENLALAELQNILSPEQVIV